jgi:tetratricopeptide (TPR) repeat protein
MSHISRLLCAAFVVLPYYDLVHAEQGILPVLVVDTQNRPIVGATLSVGGDGGNDTTGSDGRARIRLADETKANSTVYIHLAAQPLDPEKKIPLDLVFISPWDGYVLVPPFENENKNFIKIVLAERGSRLLLEYGDAAKAMVSHINAKSNTSNSNTQMTPEERKQAALAEAARNFGLTPAEVDRAIRQWGATAKDDHDVGLAKFYADNFEEARVAFSEAKAQRKKEVEKANDLVAESAFFEGEAYHRQAKYQEAIASYEEALTYRPNATNIMSALAYTLQLVRQFEKAEPLLKRALEINEKNFGQFHDEVAESVEALGAFYLNRGDNEQGASQFERMVTIREKVKGPEHLDVAHDLNNLAVAYFGINKLPEAEKSLKRALSIIEKSSGLESPRLAFTLNTFASLYVIKGNLLEAEGVLKRSIAVLRKAIETSQDREKDKRKFYSDYASAAEKLGAIYLRQNRFARAQPLLKEALDYEEMGGPLTPHSVDNLSVLADLYERLGDFAAAEKLFARALEIMEKALGKEHANIMGRIIKLALVYEAQKRFIEAEGLRMRVLKIAEKVGPDSESQILLSLARFYERQKKLGQAEDYYKRALARKEGIIGSSTADVILFIDRLAGYYERQKNFVEAETHRKRILSIVEHVNKDNPSAIAAALNMMAEFYEIQKKYSEAEDYYKRAEDIVEKSRGKDHITMIPHIYARADLYETQKRFQEAELLYKRAVEITSKLGESEYRNKAVTLNYLARFYEKQKQYDQAEQLFRQAQAIIKNVKEPEAGDKIVILNNIGRCLEHQKKYAEAEAIYKQLLLIIEKENGPEHPNVGELRLKLAEATNKQGNNKEAEDNYTRALSIFERELGTEAPKVVACLEHYAAFLRGLKRDSEAVAMESRVKKIRSGLKQVREDGN